MVNKLECYAKEVEVEVEVVVVEEEEESGGNA